MMSVNVPPRSIQNSHLLLILGSKTPEFRDLSDILELLRKVKLGEIDSHG
jgi:hypothetical protein